MVNPNPFDTLFQNSAKPVLEEEFGVSIKLRRAGGVSSSFTAIRCDQDDNVIGQEVGLHIRIRPYFYEFDKADAVVNGVTVEPRAGDIIEDGTEQYEIHPPSSTKPAVESIDGDYRWRCYADKVK